MEVLSPENIKISVAAKNQKEVFENIAKIAVDRGYAKDEAGVIKGLYEREALGTTGAEGGFAIPHVINETILNAGVIILSLESQVADWETFDDKPVDFVISLLAPKGAGQTHLKILSTLSGLLVNEDFQREIKEKTTPNEIYDYISKNLSEKL